MASVTAEECVEVEEKDEPIVKLPKGKRLFFVAILYLLFCFDIAIRYGVNSVLPAIQEDLQISNTEIGLLSSAVFLGMAIFVMPFSYLGEQKSQRRTISLLGVLWSGVTVRLRTQRTDTGCMPLRGWGRELCLCAAVHCNADQLV
ncbi:MAG: MFS transporter [Peptococcaceae bacterium]|nr:MFS transporter [Peptococcaceae bacterium]